MAKLPENQHKSIRRRVQIMFNDPSLTKQEYKEESDINNIVARSRVTGELPQTRSIPQYGDFSSLPDYQTALNTIQQADEAFLSLDSKIRARFDNNPGALIDFLQNPANLKEAIDLGIIEKPPLEPPKMPVPTPPEPTKA